MIWNTIQEVSELKMQRLYRSGLIRVGIKNKLTWVIPSIPAVVVSEQKNVNVESAVNLIVEMN
jgi:hypothetical protein